MALLCFPIAAAVVRLFSEPVAARYVLGGVGLVGYLFGQFFALRTTSTRGHSQLAAFRAEFGLTENEATEITIRIGLDDQDYPDRWKPAARAAATPALAQNQRLGSRRGYSSTKAVCCRCWSWPSARPCAAVVLCRVTQGRAGPRDAFAFRSAGTRRKLGQHPDAFTGR